jgi:acetolactate synthase-1/2/3 large subunit
MNEVEKTGAEILVDFLISRGVRIVFCITGAGNLAIIDAIVRDKTIEIIYSHHEQAAVMEAQGYSRISGELGVALVTTGGGTSNVVTGVLSAHLDSIPVLIISGNESSFHCENHSQLRAYGVQGFDSVSVLSPITKFSQRIKDVQETRAVMSLAVDSALENRKGPSHVDFPMDLQRKSTLDKTHVKPSAPVDLRRSSALQIQEFVGQLTSALNQSLKPTLYIGNGCRDRETNEKIQQVIKELQIPYFVSWSAIDLFWDEDPLNFGRVGIYGDRAANLLLQKSDLILTLGTRLAIPQLGYDREDFARKASKWIVEIDPSECEKFSGLNWNVLNADVDEFVDQLISSTYFKDVSKGGFSDWVLDGKSLWNKLPRLGQVGPIGTDNLDFLHSAEVIDALNSELAEDAIVSTDVGAGLLTGHYMYEQRKSRRFFTSQGLGEMGFGLPSAIGAHFADKAKQIVCLNTDGAIMFNLQELQLVTEHQIPLKLFIFNNSGYSMIRISQNNLFESRVAGSTTNSGISFPEFRKLAELFGLKHISLEKRNDWKSMLKEGLRSNSAVLFEVIMNPEQKYLPRLATSKLSDGTLISPPIEDLDPLLELSDLEEYLGYPAHQNSRRARGIQ